MRLYLTLLWAFLAIVGTATAGKTTGGCDRVKVESKGSREEKDIKAPIISMEIDEEKDRSEGCVRGQSFGFEGTVVWADNNCRAYFTVCEANCAEVKLESEDGERESEKVEDLSLPLTITMTKEKNPKNKCVKDTTFGVFGRRAWVNGDCHAEFLVCEEFNAAQTTSTDTTSSDTTTTASTTTSTANCAEVKLKSEDGERESEKVEGLSPPLSITMTKEKNPKNKCVKDTTFGVFGKRAWVNGDCHAEFLVCEGGQTQDTTTDTETAKERRLREMFGNKPAKELRDEARRRKKELFEGMCTCVGWGDPHFTGDDGATVHFQGVCEYTVWRTPSTVTGGCGFDISAENEERDKDDVSFIKKVNIRMFGQEITLGKDNAVYVNGIQESAGLSVSGKYTVQAAGTSHLIFDASEACGVIVSFEDNHKALVLAKRGVYAGKMSGLCGNCNGDESDDYKLADGSSPSSTKKTSRNAEIGESWRVIFGRDDLPAGCNNPTMPTPEDPDLCKDDATKTTAEEACGLMKSTTGPFKDCMTAMPTEFMKIFESCVEDQCAFGGVTSKAKRLKCAAYEQFAERCDELGVEVDWREAVGCVHECPAHSQFFEMMPSCQPSCMERDPKGRCRRIAVSGCLCDEGYVISGGGCVAEADCGCRVGRRNRLVELGEVVLNRRCTRKYTCVKQGSEATMVRDNYSCHRDAYCGLQDGDRKCICKKNFVGDGLTCTKDEDAEREEEEQREEEREERATGYCTCNPWGDPHYIQYDRSTIHFMGKCTYLVSGTITTGNDCDFNVYGKNREVFRRKLVSFTDVVYIETRGVTVRMGIGKTLMVNGEERFAPVTIQDKGIEITDNGEVLEMTTSCDVHIRWDGDKRLYIRVPKNMGDNLQGLCGDCDGQRNEWVTKDGTDVSRDPDKFMKIGNSWKVANREGKSDGEDCDQTEPEPECTGDALEKVKANDQCGRLFDPNGPFKDCIDALELSPEEKEEMMQSCIIDACTFQDTEELDGILCKANEEMAAKCRAKGIFITWRTPTFCAMDCPENSVYKPDMRGCLPSCLSRTMPETCDKDDVEGCQCNDGYIMDNGKCIDAEDCGCVSPVDGSYVPRGEQYYSADCSHVYTCEATEEGSSIFTTQDTDPALQDCGNNAACAINPEGQPQCTCNEGYMGDGQTCEPNPPPATCFCRATGDPRILQYDGTWVKVFDPCKYSLSQATTSGDCWFSVEMKTVMSPTNTAMSYIYQADVKLSGGLTVRFGPTLDVLTKTTTIGEFQALPALAQDGDTDTVGVATLVRSLHSIKLTTDCGLTVIYLDSGEIQVEVPETMAPNLSGMCGNCNGDWRDDRRDLTGKRPADYATREQGYRALSKRFIVFDDSAQPDTSEECRPPTQA